MVVCHVISCLQIDQSICQGARSHMTNVYSAEKYTKCNCNKLLHLVYFSAEQMLEATRHGTKWAFANICCQTTYVWGSLIDKNDFIEYLIPLCTTSSTMLSSFQKSICCIHWCYRQTTLVNVIKLFQSQPCLG